MTTALDVRGLDVVKGYLVGSPTFSDQLATASAAAVAGNAVPELILEILAAFDTVRDCTACAARAAVVLTTQALDA